MQVGDRFPDFVLPDENGEEFDSKMLSGIRYIIYFYPKDNTSGCTKEAVAFNEIYQKMMIRNIPIIGVNADSAASHTKFREKYGLKFKLLTDKDHTLMKAADVWGLKSADKEGIIRSTFVIGKDGTIEACWYKVKVDGHVEAVEEKVKSLIK